MKKSSLLNDVFPERSDHHLQEKHKLNNVTRFLECFTSSGKPKQIRILQIGGTGPTTLAKKPFITSQPVKKTITGLFNNEIIFKDNPKESKGHNFRVDATKTG